MEVNRIHKDLKKIYKGRKLKSITGISFEDDNEIKRIMELFRNGYWHLMPFGFDTYNNYSIKLNPESSILSSPVTFQNNSDSLTFAPDLESFFVFQQLKFMDSASSLEDIIINEWDDFEELTFAFREYTNSPNSLDQLHTYIQKPELGERLDDSDNYPQVYLDIWELYNSTDEQRLYASIMKQMVEKETYLPPLEKYEFGIWNSRMASALGQKAYGQLQAKFEDVEPYLWNSLIQPHGYDSVDLSFGIVPNPSSDSCLSLDGILDKFDPNPLLERNFSEEVLEHPLYDAIQDLRVKKAGYMGEKHVEAAKVLHLEHNDPVGAWNALVSASYWAGRNRSKAIEPMWEAAIALSSAEGWLEINEVLIQQYEFYNNYKDKV